MLHVFHVDGGRMLTLDTELVTGQVRTLQSALCEVTDVGVSDQVLLISGGEVLDPSKPVSSYPGAGTDSNPIFLASRRVSEHPVSDSQEVDDVRGKLREAKRQLQTMAQTSQSSFDVIQRLAALSHVGAQNADACLELCKRVVDDQHMLHQGWNTLVANLEDTIMNFSRRVEKFRNHYHRFLESKGKASELLRSFDESLNLLAQIPLPDCLLSEELKKTLVPEKPALSLLDWINASDPEHSLEDIIVQVKALLDEMEKLAWSEMEREWREVETNAKTKDMREIRGLGKRFSQIDEYFQHVEEMHQEQRKWADSVSKKEQEALNGTRDNRTLEDMRRNQVEHLTTMLSKQEELVSIASKFCDSKLELLTNIRRRLSGWITDVHRTLLKTDGKVTLYGEKLSALRRRLELLRQIHEAPTVYASVVAEVLRRKSFSQDFMTWSSQLVEKSQLLREEETQVRRTLSGKLDRHFLRSLFTGMGDEVPEFANERPELFDQNLPPLGPEQLRHLRESVKSLASLLQVSRPNVYERLSVTDPSTTTSGLRREPSFFSATPPKLFGLGARSFPSSTWLSGDENLDFSPVLPGAFQARSPQTRLDFAPLGHRDEASPSAKESFGDHIRRTPESPEPPVSGNARSAPIRIPSRAPSDAMSTSRQLSEKSSRFGTPEEELGVGSSGEMGPSPPEMISHSEVKEIGELARDLLNRVTESSSLDSKPSFALQPSPTHARDSAQDLVDLVKNELEQERRTSQEIREKCQRMEEKLEAEGSRRLASELVLRDQLDLLALCRNDVEALKSELTQAEAERKALLASQTLLVESSRKEIEEKLKRETGRIFNEERQKAAADYETVAKKLAVGEQKLTDAEAQLANYEKLILDKDAAISGLEEGLENERQEATRKMVEACQEIRKELIIDHELQMDDVQMFYRKELQAREDKIQALEDNLREKSELVVQFRKDQDKLMASICEQEPFPSPSQDSLKQMLEKEYKDKLTFLTKGMEEKKTEALERCQKEKEVELRLAREEKEKYIRELREAHRLELEALRQELHEPAEAPEELKSPSEDAGMTASASMYGSVMTLPQSAEEARKEDADEEAESPSNSKLIQTSLRLKDLRCLVSIVDLREGDTILVVYADAHRCYVVFSTSPTLHFIKESCSKRLGLVAGEKNWILARLVKKADYCQIKKEQNRYGLPLNTKFYRVEVERLDLRQTGRVSVSVPLPLIQEVVPES